jgi:SAM-dependent methyltransferase
LDAQGLPFKDVSFDVVVFYEAIYYLARPDNFVAEARRVLRPGGTLLICTANKDRPGFVRSPHSHRYFSAHELRQLLGEQGFSVELFGAFPVAESTAKDRFLSFARRAAVALNLVPGTLKGRELLKRLVYGKLEDLKGEVREGMAELGPLVPISGTQSAHVFKVVYAIAYLT